MRTRSYLPLLLLLVAAGCSEPRDPISVGDGMIVVENQSEQEWRNVVVTVNDHFRGGARTLAAGSRLNAPLSQFETGFGQRFDRDRMSVSTVIVTATDGAGQPVRLEWDRRGKRRPQN